MVIKKKEAHTRLYINFKREIKMKNFEVFLFSTQVYINIVKR